MVSLAVLATCAARCLSIGLAYEYKGRPEPLLLAVYRKATATQTFSNGFLVTSERSERQNNARTDIAAAPRSA